MKIPTALLFFLLLSCSKSPQKEEINKTDKSEPGIHSTSEKSNEVKEIPKSKETPQKEISASPWKSEITYEEGDTVKQGDKFWIANRKVYQNTPPPDSWFWRPLSSSKEKDDTYNAGITYDSGVTVLFEGKKYEARRKVFLNTTPGDKWFWKEIIQEEEPVQQ